MKLSQSLANLEEILTAILEQVREMKVQARDLEEQNDRLREELYELKGAGEARTHLEQLYREGFHVCPAHFARPRMGQEDCLFCLNFLNHPRQGVD